jgi:hypothetical protein
MTPLNIRLTGIVSILAGICIVSGGTMHYFFHNPFGHWIMYIGDLLLVFALTGLYALQAHQSGLMGLLGYGFSTLGTMILSVSSFLILADVYGLKAAHDTWMFMYFDASLYLPGLYAKMLGFILLGLSIAYARVLPRWAGIFLALSAVAALPAELLQGMIFMYLVSVTLTMAGLVWMGLSLLKPGLAEMPTDQPLFSHTHEKAGRVLPLRSQGDHAKDNIKVVSNEET